MKLAGDGLSMTWQDSKILFPNSQKNPFRQGLMCTNHGKSFSGAIVPRSEGVHRVRIKLIGNDGAESWFPHPNEPRPALSFAAMEPQKPGKIPMAFLHSIGTNDLKRLKGGSRNNGWSAEDRERWEWIRKVQTSIPVYALWTDLVMSNSWTTKELSPLRPIFHQEFAKQKKLIEEFYEIEKFSEQVPRVRKEIAQSKAEFLKATEKQVPSAVFKMIEATVSKPNGNQTFEEAHQQVLRQVIDVDFQFYSATAQLDISDAQLVQLKKTMETAVVKRSEMSAPVKQAMQGNGDWNVVQTAAGSFSEQFSQTLGTTLSSTLQEQLAQVMQKRFIPQMRPRRTAADEKKTRLFTGHEDLVELVESLEKTKSNPAAQWDLIQARFDVLEVARYYAVNHCLSHWDAFFNNYYLYHDTGGTEKWSKFPWDQDKTWGEYDGKEENEVFYTMGLTVGMEGDIPPGWPKDRKPLPRIGAPGAYWWRPGGYISKPLLANPQFRKIFLQQVKSILEKDYSEPAFFPVIAQYGERLREEVKIRAEAVGQDPAEAQKLLEFNLEALRKHLVARRKFLLDQQEIKNL